MKASVSRLALFVYLQTLFIFSVPQMRAQSNLAQLSGLVTDSSDAVLSRANVLIVNQDTGILRAVHADSQGQFTAPALQPGRYRITVEADGFKTFVTDNLTLNVAQKANVSFQLQVGSEDQTVTVDGSGVQTNTTDGSVSTVIDRQFVENLPLNGRSFQSLLYLSPGVSPNVASSNSNLAYGQFVVNGQRGDTNYWMVDGVSANIGVSLYVAGAGAAGAVGATNALGGTSALVSLDAMQEFRIETSTYPPEFGREPGGQISIQTRPGTNQFHGALFDYLRNGDLDATDWFADHDRLSKPIEIQNDFGGVLGGPVLENKMFFFISYEGLRLRLPQTFLGTVPDMATRASAVPAMQPYLNAYPVPAAGAVDVSPGLAAYNVTFSEPGSADAYSLRIDHQLFKNLSFFARYSHAPSSVAQRGADSTTANVISDVSSVTKTGTAGATWMASRNIVDDLRFNYSVSGGRVFWDTDDLGGGTPFPTQNLFASGSGATFQNSDVFLIPTFGTNMRLWYGLTGTTYQHQYNVVDALAVQIKSHALKCGVDYRRLSPATVSAYEQLLPLFDTMEHMAEASSYVTEAEFNPPQAFELQNLSAFAQDTWRVNPRLNLTYGLRWDLDFVPTDTTGLGFAALTNYSATNLADLGLGPAGTPPYSTRYGNLAPRIGGAYRISDDPDWGLVARGGFGVFYGLSSTEIFNANWNNAYYPLAALNVFTDVAFPTTPNVAVLPVIQPPNIQNGETLFGFDPHLSLPYALEWNIALEESLGKTQSLSLSYIGASNKRMLTSEYITNPNPNYASASLVGNAGYSDYQALQAQFQRRLQNGLQALVSYTWSHSIDTGSYGAYTNGTFAAANANRGDSDYDVRNAFSGALTYNLPGFRNNLFARAMTSDWSTDDIVQVRSGSPIDVTDGNYSAISQVNHTVVIRPDVVSGQPLYLAGPQYPGRRALNPASFTDPPIDPVTGDPLRQGDLSRNARRALGLAQWDFAIRREFRIHEKLELQFRAELFNILNHPNFGPFNSTFQTGNAYFGQSTKMLNQYLGGNSGTGTQNSLYTPGSPRSGEFALKLVF